MFVAPEVLALERRNERISAVITTSLMVLLFIIAFVFTAYRHQVPPPGKKYEVLGAIDFGDYKKGSKKINTLERSVPDPVETPPTEAAKPTPAPAPAETSPTPPPQITTPKPSPVSQPDPPKTTKPDPTPKPPKTVTPTPAKPTPTQNDTQTKPTESKPAEKPNDKPTSQPSGANHGDAASGTGNSGTPDIKILDPNGLYSFGQGTGGGLQGRSPLALPEPSYTAQEEGALEFDFWIDRSGKVVRVKARPTNKIQIKQAGINAIRKWKFSALPAGQGADIQGPIRVTITFKLKG